MPVPVGSALCDLATEFTGARAVVVDDVIEGDVRTGEQLFLLRDDEGAVNICNGGVVRRRVRDSGCSSHNLTVRITCWWGASLKRNQALVEVGFCEEDSISPSAKISALGLILSSSPNHTSARARFPLQSIKPRKFSI